MDDDAITSDKQHGKKRDTKKQDYRISSLLTFKYLQTLQSRQRPQIIVASLVFFGYQKDFKYLVMIFFVLLVLAIILMDH